jgi:hypothetical protein
MSRQSKEAAAAELSVRLRLTKSGIAARRHTRKAFARARTGLEHRYVRLRARAGSVLGRNECARIDAGFVLAASLFQIVGFDDGVAGCVSFTAQDGGIVAGGQRCEDR